MNWIDAKGTGSNDVKKIYNRMQKAKEKRAKYVDKNGPFAGTPDYGLSDVTVDWNRNFKEMSAYVESLRGK